MRDIRIRAECECGARFSVDGPTTKSRFFGPDPDEDALRVFRVVCACGQTHTAVLTTAPGHEAEGESHGD